MPDSVKERETFGFVLSMVFVGITVLLLILFAVWYNITPAGAKVNDLWNVQILKYYVNQTLKTNWIT